MGTRRRRKMPTAERIATLFGAAIVAATLGFLTFETFRRGEQEPVLSASVVHVRETPGGFVVDVDVRNESRGAAVDVHLSGGDARQPQAQARVDYLPGFSSRRVTFVFDSNPGKAPIVRVTGYARP